MASSEATTPQTAVFQLRADQELLQTVKDLAARHRVSANRYLVDAVREKVAREKDREWQAGFEAMGRDPDMDVEYLLPVAREAVLGG